MLSWRFRLAWLSLEIRRKVDGSSSINVPCVSTFGLGKIKHSFGRDLLLIFDASCLRKIHGVLTRKNVILCPRHLEITLSWRILRFRLDS